MRKVILGFILIIVISGIKSFAETKINPFAHERSEEEITDIFSEFAASMVHTSLTGASAQSSVLGFEVGVIAITTDTPMLDKVLEQSISTLTSARIYTVVSLPYAITIEHANSPLVTLGNVKTLVNSFAAKWTFSEAFPNYNLPLNMALKAQYSSAEQTIENVTHNNGELEGELKFENQTVGLQLLFSMDLLLFEPYVSLGFLRTKGNIDSTTLSEEILGASNLKSNNRGTHSVIGVDVNLGLLKAGVEYQRFLGIDKYHAKVGFSF